MKIFTPIREKTQKLALKKIIACRGKSDGEPSIASATDGVEIWLDLIGDLEIPALLKHAKMPVICVCKDKAEGGRFTGNRAQMAGLLIQAAKCGADYIDIPFSMPKNLSKKIVQQAPRNVKIIISFHDFKKTPSLINLQKLALKMCAKGADIVKIACMARTLSDTLQMVCLAQILQSKKIPHILIAMGKKGTLSRVLTPKLGGDIMFAPLSSRGASAPGQLKVNELRAAWNLLA
jgi:3-dehydroquinate dehydratase type I